MKSDTIVMVVVTAGYIAFEVLFPAYSTSETTAMPAQEVPGFGKFKECRKNLKRALTALETGTGELCGG